jgi:hypothetical protein
MVVQKTRSVQGIGGRSPIMKKHRDRGKDLQVLAQIVGFSDALLLVPTIGFNFSKNPITLNHQCTGWACALLVLKGDPIARAIARGPVR